MDSNFTWLSPLGTSVILFLLIGFLWIFVGALTVPLMDSGLGSGGIFISGRTDAVYFDGDPTELLATNQALAKLQRMLLTVIAGFLLLAGVAFVTLAWYGVRRGHLWAVNGLGLSTLLAELLWALALLPYVRAGIPLTLGDLPPLMWVPALLILPAVILGWVGLL